MQSQNEVFNDINLHIYSSSSFSTMSTRAVEPWL